MVKKPVRPKRRPFKVAGKNTVKDFDGYAWTHVATVDEVEAKRLKLFYERSGKDYKIVKSGNAYDVLVRKG
jgi:hypothetical protein